jgi:hypothetical protein
VLYRERMSKSSADYQVQYLGGLAEYPKAKHGFIDLTVGDDGFTLDPTRATAKWWQPLTLKYSDISSVSIADRTVSTVEGLLGGVNSRQLNQKNNINIEFTNEASRSLVLRLEMLSGVTVMGQAKKCQELEDRLRSNGILELLGVKS